MVNNATTILTKGAGIRCKPCDRLTPCALVWVERVTACSGTGECRRMFTDWVAAVATDRRYQDICRPKHQFSPVVPASSPCCRRHRNCRHSGKSRLEILYWRASRQCASYCLYPTRSDYFRVNVHCQSLVLEELLPVMVLPSGETVRFSAPSVLNQIRRGRVE